MFPFSPIGSFDHTEKKALLIAALSSVLFIALCSSIAGNLKRVRVRKTIVTTMTPATPAEPSEPSLGAELDRFRTIPRNFIEIDFNYFSYGVYMSPEGKPLNLTLNEGTTWDASGWFHLQDVYYKDITGDGSPEAIVRLLHLRCNGTCDGGSDVFYIYSKRNGKLKNIWRYETGSYAYGCGLKSLTLSKKQIVVELFGRCASQVTSAPGPSKFMVEDLTFTLFEFDGGRFKTKTIEYIPEPMRNVKSWEPEILIY